MKNYALDVLSKCIDEIKNTSEEQFIKNKQNLGLNDKTYDVDKYINEDIEIIMYKEDENTINHEITQEYSSIKIKLEDTETNWNDNFYPVEYEEASNISVLAA